MKLSAIRALRLAAPKPSAPKTRAQRKYFWIDDDPPEPTPRPERPLDRFRSVAS